MKNQPSLSDTIAALKKLAFKQLETFQDWVTALHEVLEAAEKHPNHEHLELVLKWITVAYTLRPVDFKNLAQYICELIKTGQPLPPQIIAGLENMRETPPKGLQKHMVRVEHRVAKAQYDQYITASARSKYRAAERAARKNPAVKKALEEFRAHNPEFVADKKLRRRVLSMERNFKPDEFYFKPTPEGLARFELESICWLFQLFGIEDHGHTALLQKLSVNVTPHGLLIFIPRYWSLDYKRDFNWKEICKILKLWGASPQGEVISLIRVDYATRCRLLHEAYEQAGKDGHAGEERKRVACSKAGVSVNITERSFFRMRKRGEELCGGKKAGKRKKA